VELGLSCDDGARVRALGTPHLQAEAIPVAPRVLDPLRGLRLGGHHIRALWSGVPSAKTARTFIVRIYVPVLVVVITARQGLPLS
jgi:hypothetical protein